MCRIDDAERCEFFTEREVAARKPHRCVECHRIIAAGEMHNYAVYKVDGVFGSDRTCLQCKQASQWMVKQCGGYVISSLLEDLVEHWREAGIHTRELARLIWGIRRKWRKRNGEMM